MEKKRTGQSACLCRHSTPQQKTHSLSAFWSRMCRDFGTGAGFYLNATKSKWKQYRMYDYVVKELPEVLQSLAGLDVHKVGMSGLQSVK